MTRHVNILMCDTFAGRLPSDITRYETLFFDLFASIGEQMDYAIYQAWQADLPDEINVDDLYLISGSLDSACGNKPWIVALLHWIEKAYCGGARMLGVCFGHQTIARALGGAVRHHPGGYGAGMRVSQVTDERMMSEFPDGQLRLLYSHYDQVTALPPGAVRCATSGFCENESFRMGNQVVTFQGHPEFTVAYSRHLLTNCCDDVDPAVRRAALTSLDRIEPQGRQAARFALNLLFNRCRPPEKSTKN